MPQPTVASKNLLLSNPARLGLAAKIWECLRRNQDFQSAIKQWRRSRVDKTALTPSMLAEIASHPYASLALEKLRSSDVPSDVETLPWNRVPRLIHAFREHAEYRPRLVEIPEPPDRLEEMAAWASKHRPLWRDRHVVAAPKFIRDHRHRMSLVYQITAQIGGREAPKAIDLEPNGSILGTPEQWEVYIFLEELRRSQNFKRDDEPFKQAAWWYSSREHYLGYKGDRLSIETRKFTSKPFKSLGAWLRRCDRTIGQHIKGIYPEFRVVR